MPLYPVYLKSCYQALGTPSLELAAGGTRTECQGLLLRRQQGLQAEWDVML